MRRAQSTGSWVTSHRPVTPTCEPSSDSVAQMFVSLVLEQQESSGTRLHKFISLMKFPGGPCFLQCCPWLPGFLTWPVGLWSLQGAGEGAVDIAESQRCLSSLAVLWVFVREPPCLGAMVAIAIDV